MANTETIDEMFSFFGMRIGVVNSSDGNLFVGRSGEKLLGYSRSLRADQMLGWFALQIGQDPEPDIRYVVDEPRGGYESKFTPAGCNFMHPEATEELLATDFLPATTIMVLTRVMIDDFTTQARAVWTLISPESGFGRFQDLGKMRPFLKPE